VGLSAPRQMRDASAVCCGVRWRRGLGIHLAGTTPLARCHEEEALGASSSCPRHGHSLPGAAGSGLLAATAATPPGCAAEAEQPQAHSLVNQYVTREDKAGTFAQRLGYCQFNVKTLHPCSKNSTLAGCVLSRTAVFSPFAHQQIASGERRSSAIVH
jgi:hypothetical protein